MKTRPPIASTASSDVLQDVVDKLAQDPPEKALQEYLDSWYVGDAWLWGRKKGRAGFHECLDGWAQDSRNEPLDEGHRDHLARWAKDHGFAFDFSG